MEATIKMKLAENLTEGLENFKASFFEKNADIVRHSAEKSIEKLEKNKKIKDIGFSKNKISDRKL
jgi:hypothetical protein